jgi:uncharacterized Fe-S center protein
MSNIYFSKDIKKILEKLDFSKLKGRVGIKVHFGEKGCDTYVNPEIVKLVYNKLKSLGMDSSLVECNVLYKGSRTNKSEHIKTAKEHGFDFAPIDILDGELGDDFMELNVKDGVVKSAKVGGGIKNYDSMIVISHFKGHEMAGFGGAIKNLGMGLGSRAGKLHMHGDVKLWIKKEKCIGCRECIKRCNFNAIDFIDNYAKINSDKCVGCAMCIAVCPSGAVRIPWGDSSSKDLQEKIVDYTHAILDKIPNMIFINVLEKITENCDCMSHKQEIIMPDVGILAGEDIVAVDKASFDLLNEKSNNKFEEINSVDKLIQINYAVKKGIGREDYEIEDLE